MYTKTKKGGDEVPLKSSSSKVCFAEGSEVVYPGEQQIKVRRLEIALLPDGRMDAKNAAKYCGLAVKTLAMMRCDGTGPKFVKIGKIFYYKEDVDTWLDGRPRFKSTAQSLAWKSTTGGKE